MLTGAVDRRQGRWDECLRNFDRAAELDPRNIVNAEEAGFTRYGIRRYSEARVFIERALALDPKDAFVRAQLATLSYDEFADVKKWRAGLSEIARDDGASHVALIFVNCALAERDRDAAARALTLVAPEGSVNPYDNTLLPRAWFVGFVAKTFGEDAQAKAAFMEAQLAAQKAVQEQPDYAPAWSLLGKAEAGLGHEAEAIAAGRRACDLLPPSKDAWDGPSRVIDLALIYTWTAKKELALNELARAAQMPGGLSYGDAKLNPAWDPLRGDPRFEKIVADLAPKETTSK